MKYKFDNIHIIKFITVNFSSGEFLIINQWICGNNKFYWSISAFEIFR